MKNRKRLEQNARADSVTCLKKASAGARDSMEEIDRLLLHGSESKSGCCRCMEDVRQNCVHVVQINKTVEMTVRVMISNDRIDLRRDSDLDTKHFG